MADPVTTAIAKLDGRDPDKVGYPTLPWRLTQLYRPVEDSDYKPVRKEGGSDPHNTPGQPWNTPSVLDEITAVAEIFTVTYDGKTLGGILIELYKKLVEKK
jgi:hypothetical protein